MPNPYRILLMRLCFAAKPGGSILDNIIPTMLSFTKSSPRLNSQNNGPNHSTTRSVTIPSPDGFGRSITIVWNQTLPQQKACHHFCNLILTRCRRLCRYLVLARSTSSPRSCTNIYPKTFNYTRSDSRLENIYKYAVWV